jgi:hypothetical protein
MVLCTCQACALGVVQHMYSTSTPSTRAIVFASQVRTSIVCVHVCVLCSCDGIACEQVSMVPAAACCSRPQQRQQQLAVVRSKHQQQARASAAASGGVRSRNTFHGKLAQLYVPQACHQRVAGIPQNNWVPSAICTHAMRWSAWQASIHVESSRLNCLNNCKRSCIILSCL